MKAIGIHALLVGAMLLAGCVAPHPSSRSPPPKARSNVFAAHQPAPIVLELVGSDPTARVTLHTIVAPNEPHQFPPGARWCDEYTVTVSNQGPAVLVVESATVVDLLGQGHRWGVDASKLTGRSREDWRAYQKAGVPVSPKIPDLDGLWFVIGTPFAAELFGAQFATPYGFVMTPFVYGMALDEAVKMRRDFATRQLRLPLRLESGQSAKGSLSFPMIPGPLHFVLSGQSDGQSVKIVIPLTVLSILHLVPGPAAPDAGPGHPHQETNPSL